MIRFLQGWRIEPLAPRHDRAAFNSGRREVDDWLHRSARQAHEKRASSTHVLLDDRGVIAGFYTLAMGEIDFGLLPPEEAKKLPKRALPVVTIAWLGLRADLQRQGLGERLLAAALAHCHRVSVEIGFVAVLIDALDADIRAYYERFDFQALPGHPLKLFLSAKLLEAIAAS